MEKKYIVGIDYGHGQTAAWIVPCQDHPNGKKNEDGVPNEGQALRLKDSSKKDFTIPSEVFVDTKGQYSLTRVLPAHVVIGLKGNPQDLEEPRREAFSNFIRLIVERLLEKNDEMLKKVNGEYNFYLCIATPTRWKEDIQKDYIRFVNDALKEIGVQVLWAINESDAAYFTHLYTSKDDDMVLVIDYGSSTIDYTLVQGGKKISEDEWSNTELGAHYIEVEIINSFRSNTKGENSFITENRIFEDGESEWDKLFASQLRIMEETGNAGFYKENVFWDEFLSHCRERKEYCFTEGKSKVLISLDMMQLINQQRRKLYINFYVNDIEKLLGKRGTGTYEEGSYIYLVKEDFQKIKRKIEQKTSKERPNTIVLSGGACTMKWVRDVTKEVWGNDCKILNDYSPEYVVANGIALYAKAQMRALEELKAKVAEADYISIYKNADMKAMRDTAKMLIPKTKEELKTTNYCTGKIIRDKLLTFIWGLNSDNETYCVAFQQSLERELSKEIGKYVSDIVETAFGVKITTDEINISVERTRMFNFDDHSFKRGGDMYKHVTELIKKSSGRKLFNFSFIRDASEIAKIVDGTVDKFLEGKSVGYPDAAIKTVIDGGENHKGIKEQVLNQLENIFYSQQLFKTTFS